MDIVMDANYIMITRIGKLVKVLNLKFSFVCLSIDDDDDEKTRKKEEKTFINPDLSSEIDNDVCICVSATNFNKLL